MRPVTSSRDKALLISLLFSIGNVNEKIRVGRLDCRNQTVVDLFAGSNRLRLFYSFHSFAILLGIGYFSLQFLVNGRAALVYAIDWNPAAIEALRRNLEVNKVANRCVVLEGDCRKVREWDAKA